MKLWMWFRRRDDMASCHEVARVLQNYIDREVDERTARRVARHLEICRHCGLEVSTYEEIKHALGRHTPALDPAALQRLQAFSQNLTATGPSTTGGVAPDA